LAGASPPQSWPAGLQARERALLEGAGLGPREALAFQQQRISISAQTLPDPRFRCLQLGKPMNSTHFSVIHHTSLPGQTDDFVFKRPRIGSERKFRHDGVFAVGVTDAQSHETERSLAAYKVCLALGFRVIPATDIASDMHGRLGIVMPFIHGRTERNATVAQLKLPLVRKQLVELQLLDALLGNVDRNHENIMLEARPGGAGVKAVWGIDNDTCFMPVKDPDALAHYGPSRGIAKLMRGVALPEVVDQHQAAVLKLFGKARLKRAVAGLIDQRDQDCALLRLKAIQRHVDRLRLAGRVIDPAEWDQAWVGRLLRDPGRSYVGRAREELRLACRQRRASQGQVGPIETVRPLLKPPQSEGAIQGVLSKGQRRARVKPPPPPEAPPRALGGVAASVVAGASGGRGKGGLERFWQALASMCSRSGASAGRG